MNVNITSQRAANVLAVPVNALLALSGGGFGVQVVTGRASHLTGVTTGLYSSTLVQVSGPDIRAGHAGGGAVVVTWPFPCRSRPGRSLSRPGPWCRGRCSNWPGW